MFATFAFLHGLTSMVSERMNFTDLGKIGPALEERGILQEFIRRLMNSADVG